MNNKPFFVKWMNEYWNKLIDIAPVSIYEEIKNKYLEEIGGYINIDHLSEVDGVLDVEFNAILFLLENWLYRHANVYEKENMLFFRYTREARNAMIFRYFYEKEDGLFHNYDLSKDQRIKEYNPVDQFYLYWTDFSNNKELALSFLKEIKPNSDNFFIIFMGLRRLGLVKEANEIAKPFGYMIDDYNPRVSTNTCALVDNCGQEGSLSLIKKAGFDTFDLTMIQPHELFTSDDYILRAEALRKHADKIGLKCNQTHNTFPVWRKEYSQSEIDQKVEYTKRILRISKIMGASNCVVHPINDFNEQQNYDFFQQFLPLARELDINIATENMWNWSDGWADKAACSYHDNFKELLDLVNDDHFVACIDIGHAEMFKDRTSAPLMIETLGNYVKCLHIHDNDRHFDRHNLALFEKIDYELVLDSLARINYQGDITFECDYFLLRMPEEMHLSCLKIMYQVGQYLKGELLVRRKAICLEK